MTDYKELISGMMGNKRFVHSCNVAEMCVKLAEIHGEDKEKAYVAGILHDIRKEIDDETLEKELNSADIMLTLWSLRRRRPGMELLQHIM